MKNYKIYSYRPGIFVQVIAATIGALFFGIFAPNYAHDFHWLTDLFLRLIMMAVGPLLFCIVVSGITDAGSLSALGRLGGRTLIYFEVMTTLVLGLSLCGAFILHPGHGMHYTPSPDDAGIVASYVANAHKVSGQGITGFILGIVPRSPVAAFTDGNTLQILFFAILTGCCLTKIGETGKPITQLINSLSVLFSQMVKIIIKLAPLGVFGAIYLTVAEYGIHSISILIKFIVYYSLFISLFIAIILGGILKIFGINPVKFARYFREEILIVTATTSSDSVLPSIMTKLERLGVPRQIVGVVVPAGYSLNLDALSIYLGFSLIFILDVSDTSLNWIQFISILATALITSKGAHGVPGVAIVVLAATIASVPTIPLSCLVLLIAVDWFSGIPRALGNLAGNCVAPIVISAWEGKLDRKMVQNALSQLDR
ncbi:C4-dicarboxylate transporter DctA [Neokomagataea tanensis]|uniref:C4-dicarboxylate transporter DctA n=2 Tax=Neokomagataea TaxID=1223423 RepID=A0A4Y6V808_9PROT|nr:MULTISPECIES: cation:dicarboxylase symporter family transporter [Neokomagataea]QDH25474.1 C4-dicarboxylate transporter DctA [Neokomagataea tanensis]